MAIVSGICKFCSTDTVRASLMANLRLDYYTLNAVGQDDFEDVKVPDLPRKASK